LLHAVRSTPLVPAVLVVISPAGLT